MSDGLTEARRGTYFSSAAITKEEYQKQMELYYESILDKVPIDHIERYLRKKKLDNVQSNKIDQI